MIIPNGTIEMPSTMQGIYELDADGFPVATNSTMQWGIVLPCQYVLSSQNQQAGAGESAYTSLVYVVYVEQPLPIIGTPLLRLTDTLTGLVIGTFKVQAVEQLTAVCQTRLTLVKA